MLSAVVMAVVLEAGTELCEAERGRGRLLQPPLLRTMASVRNSPPALVRPLTPAHLASPPGCSACRPAQPAPRPRDPRPQEPPPPRPPRRLLSSPHRLARLPLARATAACEPHHAPVHLQRPPRPRPLRLGHQLPSRDRGPAPRVLARPRPHHPAAGRRRQQGQGRPRRPRSRHLLERDHAHPDARHPGRPRSRSRARRRLLRASLVLSPVFSSRQHASYERAACTRPS